MIRKACRQITEAIMPIRVKKVFFISYKLSRVGAGGATFLPSIVPIEELPVIAMPASLVILNQANYLPGINKKT
jgi:hypothetical protein